MTSSKDDVSSPGDDVSVTTCKRTIQLPMYNLNDWSLEYRKGSRQRRQVPYRGRFRGQTQSQYLAVEQGTSKDEGKAEAISAADTSKAVVSGRSGMGQAQSQSMYDPSCDECVDRYVPGAESLRRPTGGNRENGHNGPSGGAMHSGDSWNSPGTQGGKPRDSSNWNSQSGKPVGPTGIHWNTQGQGGLPDGPGEGNSLTGKRSNWNTQGGPVRPGESFDGSQRGLIKPSDTADAGNNWDTQGRRPGGLPGGPGGHGGSPSGRRENENILGVLPGNNDGGFNGHGGPGQVNSWNIQSSTPGSPDGRPGGQEGPPGSRSTLQGQPGSPGKVNNWNQQGRRPSVQGEPNWNPQGGGPDGRNNWIHPEGLSGGTPGNNIWNTPGGIDNNRNLQRSALDGKGNQPDGGTNWNTPGGASGGGPGEVTNWSTQEGGPGGRGPPNTLNVPSGTPGGQGGERGEHGGRPVESGSWNSQSQPPGEIRGPPTAGVNWNKPGTGYWPPFLAKDWSVLTGAVPDVPQGSTYFCCVVGPNPPQYIGASGGGFGMNGNTGPTIFNMEPNSQGGRWNGQGSGPGGQVGGWNGQGGTPGGQGGHSAGQSSPSGGGWNGQVRGPGTQGGGWNGQGGGTESQGGGAGGQGGPSGSRWNGQGGGPGSQGGGSGGQGGLSGGGWNLQRGPGSQGGVVVGQGGPSGGGWNGQGGAPGSQGGGSSGQGGLSGPGSQGGGWNGQGGVPGSQGSLGGQGGPSGPGSQGRGWNRQGGGPGSQGGSGGQVGPSGPGSQGGGWNGQGGGPGSQGDSGGQGVPSGTGSQGGGWNGQGGGPGSQGGGSGGQGDPLGWNGQGPSSQGGGSGGQGGPSGGGWNGQGGGPDSQRVPGSQGGSGGQGGPSGGVWNGQGAGPDSQGGGSGGQRGPSGEAWNSQGEGPGSQGGRWNGQGGGTGGQGGALGGGWNGQVGGPSSQGGGWNGQGGGQGIQGGGSGGQGGPSGEGWNGPGGGPGSQGGWNGQEGSPRNQEGGTSGQGRPSGGGWNGQGGSPGSYVGGSGGQGGPSGGGWNGQGGGPGGQGGNEQIVPGNNRNHVPPQNVIDPNSIAADGDDSQAESSITQNTNGTMAIASSNGGNDKGKAKTQVSGTYAGSGTFSAQAEISDESKGAQSEVSGGKQGAISIAQGHSQNSKSQANVNLGSESGSLISGAQSDGVMHSSNTQVQGGVKGGSAEAQARGPGSTSSQAQIGFTPFKDSDRARHDLFKTPFVGAGKASSHSNGRIGESQSQLEGTFKYGIKYTGAAQSGASLDKDAVFASRLPFNKIDVFDKSDVNINVDDTETPLDVPTPLPLPDISEVQNNIVNITEKPQRNSGDVLTGHTHLDHHIPPGNDKKAASINPPPAGNTRSFQPSYGSNNADFDYTSDKEDNPSEDYDADGGPEGSDAVDGEYNYEDFGKDTETHQSLHTPSRKSFEIKQSTGGNTQHIVLGALHGQDAIITQHNTDQRPDESKIYQPGESVPGTGGYTIPIGFTGSVKSVASKQNTYAIGTRRSPSQAQTVSLTPGSGKVKYVYPYPNVTPYGKYVAPKDLRSYSNNEDDSNRYVSVSKTVTGALDNENNIRKQYSHTYYTKSSSCGYFTFTCTMVSGPHGRKKVCKPKIPTNPDGTPMRC